MDDNTERRLRDADPLARRTTDDARDQEWLGETARTVTATPPRKDKRRGLVLVAAAAALVLAASAGGFLLGGGDDADNEAGDQAGLASDKPTAAAPTVTDLSMPATGAMGLCIAFSVEELAKAPVAFDGTVVERSGEEVLLDVGTWYRGGDSDQVRLTDVDLTGTSLADYGIDLEPGQRYLISAYDGRVSTCGFSVPWSEGMEDKWKAAFGG